VPILRTLAPGIFAEYAGAADIASGAGAPAPLDEAALTVLAPYEQGPMRVTLLGYTQPLLADPELALHHGAATFFFEGISRTCTHQLVRHRLASFSQESQRYVDLSKGGWRAIVPPAVAEHPQAMAELDEFWQIAEEKYAALRKMGIRKEDARFLLPNAAETRIVATMNFAAWSHFPLAARRGQGRAVGDPGDGTGGAAHVARPGAGGLRRTVARLSRSSSRRRHERVYGC
jgi:hypothetical protein